MKTCDYNFNKIHNTCNCHHPYLWASTFSENLFEFKEYFCHKQVYGILMKKRVYVFMRLITGFIIIFIISVSSVKLSSNGMTQKIVPLFSHTSTTFANFPFYFCFDEHMASYLSSVFLLLLFFFFCFSILYIIIFFKKKNLLCMGSVVADRLENERKSYEEPNSS